MKWMKTAAAVSLIALASAGCSPGSGNNASTDGSSAAASSGGVVVIKYISSTILESPEGDFEQKVIDDFNAQNNGVKVEVEGVATGDLLNKYTALATTNQMPDFYMDDIKDTAQLVDMGIAEDVRNVFDSNYLNSFTAAALAGVTVNGVPSGIPWFSTAQGIVYRTDLFAAAGVKVPTTWDELVAAAKQLTGNDKYGIALVGTKDSSGAGRFQYVLRNFGVDEFTQDSSGKWQTDIGSDNYVAALKAFTDLDTVDGVVPPGVTETGYAAAVNLLASGQAAMLITGSNAIGAITSKAPELKGSLGSFPIPAVNRAVTTQSGYGFFVSPTSEHKDAVAKFLQFMVSDEKAIEFSKLTGRLPTLTTAAQNPEISQDLALGGFLKSLTAADVVYIAPPIPGYGEINDIEGEAFQSVFTGSATPEQAAAQAQQRAQALVDKANG